MKMFPIPKGCVAFPHQVAGHRFEEGKRGLLLDKDGQILKPVQEPPRGEREINFYQNVFGEDVSDSVTLKLRSFLPTFHGIDSHSDSSLEHNYIKLEDLTKKFNKPCILDIKIGRTVFDHFATRVKRERCQKKYPEQEIFGFRILGMKVYKKALKMFKFYDKSFGRKLKTHQEILEGFREFFCLKDHGEEYILQILEQCKAIESWVKEQRRFQLFSSSILIVYEGEPKTNVENDLKECTCSQKMTNYFTSKSINNRQYCTNNKHVDHLETYRTACHEPTDGTKCPDYLKGPKATVRLVDFAHTYIGSYTEPDTNYLYGLQSIMQFFDKLLMT